MYEIILSIVAGSLPVALLVWVLDQFWGATMFIAEQYDVINNMTIAMYDVAYKGSMWFYASSNHDLLLSHWGL